MTREEQIKKIYQKISDRTLSRWCKFTHDWIEFIHSWNTNSDEIILECIKEWTTYIIWHPVMIWDVLDFMENDFVNASNWLLIDFDLLYLHKSTINLFNIWKEKRKPIEEQSEEVLWQLIDYLSNIK